MPSRGMEHGFIDCGWHEHTPRRQFLEGRHQPWRRMRLLSVVAWVGGTVFHVRGIKCVRPTKGSFLEEIFGTRILPEHIQRVVQAGLHRPERNARRYGDLGQRQAIHVTQQERFPVFLGEADQGR